MKHTYIFYALILLYVFAAPIAVIAATGDDTGSGFVPLATEFPLTEGVIADETGLANFLQNLYRYLIGVAVIIAIIQIIRGGLEISTESVFKKTEGKEHIREALIGLLLVLSPVIVFSIINPSILNLSIPLQNIKLIEGTQGGGSGSSQSSVLEGGVTLRIIGTYFKKASFSSSNPDKNNEARDTWAAACGGFSGVTESSECAPGGYTQNTDGTRTCTSATDAKAFCSVQTPEAYSFVDISNQYNFLVDTLAPLSGDRPDVQSFISECRALNDMAGAFTCVSRDTYKDLAPCPEAISGLDENTDGECHTAKLFCSSSSAVGQNYCESGVEIQQ